MKQKKTKNYIALFAAVFIWASAFIVTKIALVGFGPITLSFIRMIIAFIILLPFAWKRGFRFKSVLTKNSFIYGIFGYGGNLVILSLGLLICSSNISAIVHGLFPVFMIVFGNLLLKEKFTKYKVAGITFSVIGVLIASIGDLANNTDTTILGIILVSLSVLTWAFYSVYAKKTASEIDSFVLSEICFGASLICTVPYVVAEIFFFGFALPDTSTLLCLLYLGSMSGAAAILLWNYGLKKVESGVAGIYFNLMPVIGLFFALFAGENITYLQILGCGLVLIGVFVGTKKCKKEI